MMQPPDTLDCARVLYWAWSATPPFFIMTDSEGNDPSEVCGLAICQYDSGKVYRFSCDREWEVLNDSPFASADAAMRGPSGQYDITRVRWVAARPA